MNFLKTLYVLNDVVWAVTAICCMFFDNIFLTAVICATTVIYIIDLVFKFKDLGWKLCPFLKKYWLDLLFLIPFIKICRAMRVFKAGRLIFRVFNFVDAVNDLMEIAVRVFRAVKKIPQKFHR